MEGDIRNDAYPSSSTLSLPVPGGSHNPDKRRLLLIYIHGFMGTEASFQELPAHIHDLLTGLLSESHVVYTRIYPRYKSHGELQTAVDQFSAWYVIT
jgi:esterase/lipase